MTDYEMNQVIETSNETLWNRMIANANEMVFRFIILDVTEHDVNTDC